MNEMDDGNNRGNCAQGQGGTIRIEARRDLTTAMCVIMIMLMAKAEAENDREKSSRDGRKGGLTPP